MSEPGSWPSQAQPGAYPPGPYQPAGQPPPYWAPAPPGPPPGPFPGVPSPAARDRSSAPPTGAVVAACIALGLSLLIGLSRWLGAYLTSTSDDRFYEWPFRTWPVAIEILLAVMGLIGAVVVVSAPGRRSAASCGLLAVAAAVLGFTLNDGLYQLITIAVTNGSP